MKEKEKDVDGKVSSYPEKAGALVAIRGPMRLFQSFIGLADSLPDWPGILVDVKSYIRHMYNDTRKFLHQLDQMGEAMAQQAAEKDGRAEKLEDDSKQLSTTSDQASDSKDAFQDAKDTTEGIDKDNKARLDEAKKMKNRGHQHCSGLQIDADQKKAKAQSMAAELDAWAQNHRKARMDALAKTKADFEAKGYKITEVKEL